MKRFHLLLLGIALCAAVAVGYSDSNEIKKDSIQAYGHENITLSAQAADFSAELPLALIVDAPYLGSPASEYVIVSEELADVFVICIRPPPEKVQKSEFKDNSVA
jgi:hypothetical protein